MKRADKIYYGGDYNPDQWDDETIEEDMRLFKKAGINLCRLRNLEAASTSLQKINQNNYDYRINSFIAD